MSDKPTGLEIWDNLQSAQKLIDQLTRERDEARAARAARAACAEAVGLLRELAIETGGFMHEDGCPEDDTCACSVRAKHDKLRDDYWSNPGAPLLAELAALWNVMQRVWTDYGRNGDISVDALQEMENLLTRKEE